MKRLAVCFLLLSSPALADEALDKCNLAGEIVKSNLAALIGQNANLAAEVHILQQQIADLKKPKPEPKGNK